MERRAGANPGTPNTRSIAVGEQIQVLTDEDIEGIDELEDEIAEAKEDAESGSDSDVDDDGRIDPALLKEELAELRRFCLIPNLST